MARVRGIKQPHPLGSVAIRGDSASSGMKISELPAGAATYGTDQLEVNQSGTSRRITVGQIAAQITLASEFYVNVRAFGAVGDGVTDDTAALNAAFLAGVGSLVIVPPGTYKFTSLQVPANVTMTAVGAVFRSSGTFSNAAVPLIDVGANCTIDELNYSSPTGDVYEAAIWLNSGVRIGSIFMRADAQMAGEAVFTEGQDVHVDLVDTINFDYAWNQIKQTTGASSGSHVGFVRCQSYKRAVRYNNHDSFVLGGMFATVLSPNAMGGAAPGGHGVLMEGVSNFSIGDCYIEDSNESAFRIGGTLFDNYTRNGTIGVVTVVRSGGCAFKINPTKLVSPGVTETADNISVAGVRGIDVGKLTVGAGNCELLRISHVRNCTIGWAFADIEQFPISCQFALLVNAVDGLWVGSLGAHSSQGVINLSETSDADGVTIFGGNVINVHVGELIGGPGLGSNVIGSTMSSFIIGNITITGIDLTAINTNLLQVNGAQVFNGPLHVAGRVGGSVNPAFSGTYNAQITYNIAWGDARIIGNPTFARYTSRQEIAGDVLDIANVLPVEPFVSAINGTAALNAYGPGMSFSRVGSARRGGGLAVKQTGASQSNTGLALFVGSSTTASDAMLEVASFDHFLATRLNGALLTGAPVTKTANFTVGPAENDIIVNNASAITTVTMPTPSGWTGWTISLTNYSAAFTVVSASANIVPKTGGAATTAILPAAAGAWVELKSNGTAWITLRSGT